MEKIKTKKIKDSLQNIENSKLSIQFSLDGFSFSISEIETQITTYFFEYLFEKRIETPEKLLSKIEEIFKNDTYLQQDFDEVFVVHQSDLATLVPNRFFDESKLASYLKFNIKVLANDCINFEDIEEINAKNIFVPYTNINNFVFQNFGSFDFSHHHTILLQKLLENNDIEEKTMFVNVNPKSMDVLVLKHKKLELINTFSIETKEDFLYYILFVAEQLQMKTTHFQLFFTGKITKDDAFYKLAYQYIQNVNFLDSFSPFMYQNNITRHDHLILLG